jgi:type I restriction enzyme S subunit
LFPKRGAAIENNKIRVTATEILIDTNLMAITPKNDLAPEFLFYFLSNVGLAHIADTSTIPQINNKHIIPFEILRPSAAEQQRIAACLSSLDDLIAAQTQKLEALKTHKKGLMQQLFPSPEVVEHE